MNKHAWPWIGTTELEMGSMSPTGSPTDIQQDSSERYDPFVAEKFTHDNELPQFTHSNGITSPLSDLFSEIEEAEQTAILSVASKYLSDIKKDCNLLLVGFKNNLLTSLSSRGASVTALSKSGRDISENNIKIGDSRFYSFDTKFDTFCIASDHSSLSDVKMEINNIKSHLRPSSSGLIISRSSSGLERELLKMGFDILAKHEGKASCYIVKRDVKEKMATVRCYNHKSDLLASFTCDVANSTKEKIDGLQVYPFLKKGSGLLFTYSKPRDVFFHMGTVGYPIDILFIDNDDRVKKISRNISPGSIETFGCTNVKTVLEISGGLSRILDISEGSYISVDVGGSHRDATISKVASVAPSFINGGVFIKRSSNLKTGIHNILGNNVFIINSDDKEINTTSIVNKMAAINLNEPNIIAFDIDQGLISDQYIELYKHVAPDGIVYAGLDNETFSLKQGSNIKVSLESFLKEDFNKNISKKYSFACSPNKSFRLLNAINRKNYLETLSDAFLNKDTKVVLATRKDYSLDILRKFLQSEINFKVANNAVVDFELVKMPDYFDHTDFHSALREKYSTDNISLYVNSIVKNAGVPVSDSVKEQAKKVVKYFDRCDDSCRKIVDSLKKNLSEYEKIQAESDKIPGTKGQYKESIKRNSRIIKRVLLNIKEGIKLLNQIRDVSTTSEVIDSIATSAKIASDSIRDVFNLLDIIESPDFFGQLQEKTGAMENLVEDLRMSLSRAREYINSDILGILIISE